MLHFKFSENTPQYLYIKADYTDDEIVQVYDKKAKAYDPTHIFELLKQKINLTDPICYLPTYQGPPYTQDFLFEYTQRGQTKPLLYCSIGLWQEIYIILKEYGVSYDGLPSKSDTTNINFFKRKVEHTFDEFKEIVDSWEMSRTPRPYQYEAAYKILQWKMSVSQLATRAGKTLISYMIFRYAHEYMGVQKILMIVPSVDLVKQGYSDFNEYAEYFKGECIWGGGKIVESSNLSIATFQTLINFLDRKSKKYNPTFFNDYDLVFVDETHRATSKSISTIISQPFIKKVKIIFGMTGTLPKKNTIDSYCVHALLGAKIQDISPRELMDAGYISDIQINQIRLNYTNVEKQKALFFKCAEYCLSTYVEVKNEVTGKKEKLKLENPEFLIKEVKELPIGIATAKQSIYNSMMTDEEKETRYIELLQSLIAEAVGTNNLVIEKMMTHFMEERLKYVCDNILPICDKNTLILAHNTCYIDFVEEYIKTRFPNRHIERITGNISPKKRDKVKNTLKEHNDCILIASYGCLSTGITLSNLCFGVLLESFKSNVINMQSLGRGLGLSELKDKYIVYDIIDVFDKSVSIRKILAQGKEKIKIYESNKYEYNIINKKI